MHLKFCIFTPNHCSLSKVTDSIVQGRMNNMYSDYTGNAFLTNTQLHGF